MVTTPTHHAATQQGTLCMVTTHHTMLLPRRERYVWSPHHHSLLIPSRGRYVWSSHHHALLLPSRGRYVWPPHHHTTTPPHHFAAQQGALCMVTTPPHHAVAQQWVMCLASDVSGLTTPGPFHVVNNSPCSAMKYVLFTWDIYKRFSPKKPR